MSAPSMDPLVGSPMPRPTYSAEAASLTTAPSVTTRPKRTLVAVRLQDKTAVSSSAAPAL